MIGNYQILLDMIATQGGDFQAIETLTRRKEEYLFNSSAGFYR